ncbi:MAG: hypothetical protein HFI09_05285 [Bacilli bacterium]|nr:hypothetical protein [Bacilli bacterium]
MKTNLWKRLVCSACFLFLMACGSVHAEEVENPLSSILKDGIFYFDMLKPAQVNKNELNQIIAIQYQDFLKDNETTINQKIEVLAIRQDYGNRSEADLLFSSCEVGGGCGSVNVTVPIDWKVSDRFKEIVANGVFEVNAVAPKNESELDAFVSAHFMKKYDIDNFFGSLNFCNEDYSNCVLDLNWYTSEESYSEAHVVDVLWKSADSNVKNMVDTYAKKLEDLRDPKKDEYGNLKNLDFTLSDLNLVNYYSHIQNQSMNGLNSIIRYVDGIQKLFDYSNLSYALDIRAGDKQPLREYGFGHLTISYQDVVYALVESVGVWQNGVIYIPDDTENTSDAYIAAAKKRIDAYLGNHDAKIEVVSKLEDFVLKDAGIGEDGQPVDMEADFSALGDVSKMGDYVYQITIGNITKPVVMIRDSSKIVEKPVLETKDLDTNITISTDSSLVPLDTVVKVQEIKKGMESFQVIQNVLKFKAADNVQIYDLKLYSETAKDFIKSISDGKFEVRIPVRESLKGKTLYAYYVRDNGKVEEYPVTLKDGMATFLTSHFSVYTISEKLDVDLAEDFLVEDVPKTYDSILSYVVLGIFGLLGILATFKLNKKIN